MSKEVAVVSKSKGLANVDSSDMAVPKLLLMQKMSKLVDEGKAKAGEFVNSLTGESFGEEVLVVPFHVEKTWTVTRDNKFLRKEPATSKWERKFEEAGGIKNEFAYEFYVKVGDEPVPYLLSFRSTATPVGSRLISQMATQPFPSQFAVLLKGLKKSNDKGTWFVTDFSKDRAANQGEVNFCDQWAESVASQTPKSNEPVQQELF